VEHLERLPLQRLLTYLPMGDPVGALRHHLQTPRQINMGAWSLGQE
jgi:hypothetical protein